MLHLGEASFHTGWFLESLAAQTLVLFVIRTARRPWASRPSWPLTATTLLVVAVGLVLPVTPLSATLGFTTLPEGYYLYLGIAVGTYLCAVELLKERIIRGFLQSLRPACS